MIAFIVIKLIIYTIIAKHMLLIKNLLIINPDFHT